MSGPASVLRAHETVYGMPATPEGLAQERARVVNATGALGLVASLRALADASSAGGCTDAGQILAEAANRIEDGSRGRGPDTRPAPIGSATWAARMADVRGGDRCPATRPGLRCFRIAGHKGSHTSPDGLSDWE